MTKRTALQIKLFMVFKYGFDKIQFQSIQVKEKYSECSENALANSPILDISEQISLRWLGPNPTHLYNEKYSKFYAVKQQTT